MKEQVLDSMDIERERGITIKAQTVRLDYKAKDGKTYILNLMDTPGHVDFAYEVSRSLAACEGSLLVVDASQGVEAQTLANVYQALDANHEIVPVLNKIDLPAAEPDRVKAADRGRDRPRRLRRRADLGQDRHRHRRRAGGHRQAPAAAQGRRDGAAEGAAGRQLVRRLSRRRRARARHRRRAEEGPDDHDDGHRRPLRGRPHRRLPPEDDGRAASSAPARSASSPRRSSRWPTRASATPSPTTRKPTRRTRCRASSRRSRWCSAASSPSTPPQFEDLRAAMGRLRLNDASFSYEMETSAALGFGFRCGFLGLLHLEIIQERLRARVQPRPDRDRAVRRSTRSRMRDGDGRSSCTTRPTCRTSMKIEEIAEPWIRATILTPDEYLGRVLKLCQDRRGAQVDLTYVGTRAMVVYDLPLNEVVFDFYDRLKSISKGYASLRLPDHRLQAGRPREDVDPGQRRAGRRALDARAPHPRRDARPRHGARS